MVQEAALKRGYDRPLFTYTQNPRWVKLIGGKYANEFDAEGKHYEVWAWPIQETIIGVETVGVIVAAVGAAATAYGTVENQRANKKRASAEEEARDIQSAQQKQEEMEKRRQQIREQRVRQAQIEQSAANAGSSGSSGELGAVSGTQTITGSNIAFGQSTAMAAQGISRQSQVAADAALDSQIAQGIASLGGQAMSLGLGQMGGGNKLFGGESGSSTSTQLDNKMNANPSIF